MSLSAMVVDDDEFVRGTLCRQMSRLGTSRIAVAGDGEEAAKVLREQGPFDLIVLDLVMPRVDGVEFLRHLAGTDDHADIILTSSMSRKVLDTAETLARAHALHVLGVLPKPVRTPAIRELLARRGHGVEARAPLHEISVDALTAALDAGRIVPYFQPKLCARTGVLRSVEALARWEQDGKAPIAAAEFIGIAERAGLGGPLTAQISRQAFAALRDWAASGLHPDLEINLSASSLEQVDLPDQLARRARRYGIDARRVTFEIAESAMLAFDARALDVLSRLRLKGFQLAIDDFGSGHATLSQLERIPLNEIKIDQSFVAGAHADPQARAIVESCIGLAQRLGLVSVAEGIENEPTAKLLSGLGVSLLQGYWCARPLSTEALVSWWRDQRHSVQINTSADRRS